MLVLGTAEVKGLKKYSPADAMAERFFAQALLIEHQIEALCEQIGGDPVEFLCSIICEWYVQASGDRRNEIRYALLNELEEILTGHVELTAKGKKAFEKWAQANILGSLAEAFGIADDDDDEEENTCGGCVCEGCKIVKGGINVVEVKGAAADRLAKALIGEIINGGKDGKCAGGKRRKPSKED